GVGAEHGRGAAAELVPGRDLRPAAVDGAAERRPRQRDRGAGTLRRPGRRAHGVLRPVTLNSTWRVDAGLASVSSLRFMSSDSNARDRVFVSGITPDTCRVAVSLSVTHLAPIISTVSPSSLNRSPTRSTSSGGTGFSSI